MTAIQSSAERENADESYRGGSGLPMTAVADPSLVDGSDAELILTRFEPPHTYSCGLARKGNVVAGQDAIVRRILGEAFAE
jgi:hypothetical protein